LDGLWEPLIKAGSERGMEYELLRKLDIGFGNRKKATLEHIPNRINAGSLRTKTSGFRFGESSKAKSWEESRRHLTKKRTVAAAERWPDRVEQILLRHRFQQICYRAEFARPLSGRGIVTASDEDYR
jgi:hypothetical protein